MVRRQTLGLIVLLCLILSVAAQNAPVAPPEKGGALEDLLRVLEQVRQKTEENTKKIDDLPGQIENNYRRQGAVTIVGVSLTIIFIYVLTVFLDRVRRMRNKRTHEEYIGDLEARLISNQKSALERMDKTTDKAAALIAEFEDIRDKIKPAPVITDNKYKSALAIHLGNTFVGLGFLGIIALNLDDPILISAVKAFFVFSILAGGWLWFKAYQVSKNG